MKNLFDRGAARQAAHGFAGQVDLLPTEIVQTLRELWQTAYPHCGHKVLGRIVLGQTVEEATANWKD